MPIIPTLLKLKNFLEFKASLNQSERPPPPNSNRTKAKTECFENSRQWRQIYIYDLSHKRPVSCKIIIEAEFDFLKLSC